MPTLAENIVAPMLVGTFIALFMYGIFLGQVRTYFQLSRGDPLWTRMMVAFLTVAATTSVVFDCFFVYDYTIRKFGNDKAVLVITWVFSTTPAMCVIMSTTVQTFFAWRVRKLTGRTWLGLLILCLAFAQFLCGLGAAIGTGILKNFTELLELQPVGIPWLVIAPLADIIITLSLVLYLRSNRTGFSATDDLIGRINRLTVQTGGITAVWSAINLIIFLVETTNSDHLILNLPLGTVYGVCLLSSVNARKEWSNPSSDGAMRSAGAGPGINVTTSTAIHADIELGGVAPGGGRNASGHYVQPSSVQIANERRVKVRASDGLSLHSDSVEGDDDNKVADRL